MFEAAAAVMIDIDGNILMASPMMEQLFGYRPGELSAGLTMDVLLIPEVREKHRTFIRSYFELSSPRPMEGGRDVPALHSDGHTLRVSVFLTSHFDEQTNQQRAIAFISESSQALIDSGILKRAEEMAATVHE